MSAAFLGLSIFHFEKKISLLQVKQKLTEISVNCGPPSIGIGGGGEEAGASFSKGSACPVEFGSEFTEVSVNFGL